MTLLWAKARYLALAERPYADTPEGLQARYDAGRDLQESVWAAGRVSRNCLPLARQLLSVGRAQVRRAEARDRLLHTATPRIPRVTASCRPGAPGDTLSRGRPVLASPSFTGPAALPGATDARLAIRLALIGRSFDGWGGFWIHNLRSGRSAGWNADARFPAASTVKLGALAAALGRPRLAYDVEAIGGWSSNLAANRIAERLGLGAVRDGLRRLGMTSSTYPGLYRVGTAAGSDSPKPPPLHTGRTTTARDLGRALLRLYAAATGKPWAQRLTKLTRAQAGSGLGALLGWEPTIDNAGLLAPWLPGRRIAQKSGWLSDTRLTAAIVFGAKGPTIVVVEAYRPGLTRAAARRLGGAVVLAAFE